MSGWDRGALPWDQAGSPWYKRYPKDLLASERVLAMTHLQRSIYFILLERSWVGDGLPTDLRRVAALGLCTAREFRDAWVWPLDEMFEEQNGRLRSPRLESLRENRMADKQRRVENAQDTNAKRDAKRSAERDAQRSDGRGIGIGEKDRDTQKEEGAKAPAPPKKSTRQNRFKNLEQALKDSNAPEHLHGPLAEYLEARKGARMGVWSPARWEKEIAKLTPLDPTDAVLRCEAACDKPWSKVVYPGQSPRNAQPATSQAPSRGGWYKGPPLKDSEARRKRGDIRDRMAAQAGDFLLAEDDALAMARAQGDHEMHLYDWMTGLRNDAPPMQQAPHTLEIGHEPPF